MSESKKNFKNLRTGKVVQRNEMGKFYVQVESVLVQTKKEIRKLRKKAKPDIELQL